MSWLPSRPSHWYETLEVLCEAVNERLQNFPFWQSDAAYQNNIAPLLTLPVRPCSYQAVKYLITRICDRIITLLTFSMDPRQIGSWCDFSPFQNFGDRNYPSDEFIKFLEDADINADAFLLRKHPQKICDTDFALACFRLLNDFILWQSPVNSIGANKGLNVEATLHRVDLETSEYQTQKYSDGFLMGNGYERLACWKKSEFKEYATDIHFENNSNVKLYGTWQMPYYVTVSEKKSTDTQWHNTTGTVCIAEFENDISGSLELPYTQSQIDAALSHGDESDLDFHYIELYIYRENRALITRENLPELNYFYKD